MNDQTRLDLIKEVYQTFQTNTTTFEDSTGMCVAYLLGAIAENGKMSLAESFLDTIEDDPVFVTVLREQFPREHPVWGFIDETEEDDAEEVERLRRLTFGPLED
jgi:hypothetical protein